MPTYLIVTMVLVAGFVAWFHVGLIRVYSGRAKNVVEGMTPQRIVYRRLSRKIRREHDR
jgi:hypothetical protein